MIIIGTSYFPSKFDALNYYEPFGYDDLNEVVTRKIQEGEIHLGPPPYDPKTQRLIYLDQHTRYGIVDK